MLKRKIITIGILFTSLFGFSQASQDSLILFYPFNDNGDDESGNNYDASIYGVTSSADRYLQEGSAYSFDGINDRIILPDDDNLKPDFPFSVSLWFVADEFSDATRMLYSSDEYSGIYSGFYIGYNPSGSISAGYCDGQGYGPNHRRTKHTNEYILMDEWYHLTVVFNEENDIDIYLNCELSPGYYSGTGTSLGNLGGNGVIGRNLGHSVVYDNYHKGKIDDIRFYSKALNSSDILDLCGEIPQCSNLISYQDTIVVYDTTFVTITDYVSVTDTLVIDVIFSSVNEEELTTQLKVYPNPTNDLLYINTGDYTNITEYTVKIVDSAGSLVYISYLTDQVLEVSMDSFGSNGLYFVQIIDDSGELIDTRKILLQ
jgi:hypothetical protein